MLCDSASRVSDHAPHWQRRICSYESDWLVGSRAGAVPRRCSLGRIRRFRLRARLGITVGPFSAPATSNGACGFPALRSPGRFTPRVMGPIAWGALSPGLAGTGCGSRHTVPASRRATADATSSTRGPDDSVPASSAAAPSVPLSSGRRRSIDWRCQRRSTGPSRAASD
jgi:hypothetical protein